MTEPPQAEQWFKIAGKLALFSCIYRFSCIGTVNGRKFAAAEDVDEVGFAHWFGTQDFTDCIQGDMLDICLPKFCQAFESFMSHKNLYVELVRFAALSDICSDHADLLDEMAYELDDVVQDHDRMTDVEQSLMQSVQHNLTDAQKSKIRHAEMFQRRSTLIFLHKVMNAFWPSWDQDERLLSLVCNSICLAERHRSFIVSNVSFLLRRYAVLSPVLLAFSSLHSACCSTIM